MLRQRGGGPDLARENSRALQQAFAKIMTQIHGKNIYTSF